MLSLFGIDRSLMLRFVAEGSARLAGFATMPLIVRLLGAESYGALTFTQASVAAMVPLVSLGLGFSLVRQIAGDAGPVPASARLFSALALVSATALSLGTLLWLLAPVIAAHIPLAGNQIALIRVSALLLPATALQALSIEALRARQLTAAATGLQIAEAAGIPAAIILLTLAGMLSPVSIIAGIVAVKALTGLAAMLRVIHALPTGRQAPLLAPWRDLRLAVAIGLPFMVSGFGEWLMALGDRFVIGATAGPDAVGRYAAAQVMISVIASWGAPFWWVLFPRFCSTLETRGRGAAMATSASITAVFLEWGLPLLVVIQLAGVDILAVLGGPRLQVEPSVIAMLALATFINQAATPWEYALYAERRGAVLMRATLTWGTIAFAGTWAALPVLGLPGAALAILAGRLGFAVWVLVVAGRIGYGHAIFAPPDTLKRIAIATVGAGLAVAAGYAAALPSIILAGIFAATYLALALPLRLRAG